MKSCQPYPRGRLLGIDYGKVRIGVAISDATGLVARELTIINRKSKAQDFETLRRIAADNYVVALVVGLPVDVDRAERGLYSSADTVRMWTQHLRTALPLPIIFWDETMTSVDARELARRHKRKPDAPVDDLAARLMLQSYLDALREGLADPPSLDEGRE
jgi:putative Holliday junction resolvase